MQTPTLTIILFIAAALLLIIIVTVLLIWLQTIQQRKTFREGLSAGDELTIRQDRRFITGWATDIDHRAGTCSVMTDSGHIMHARLNQVHKPFDKETQQILTSPL
ncbi:MAG TPA: hypothetical protein DEO70_12035 [Bacteroidales bacterium]|nr:MAG: hypothetical protein A2X11_10025 [Bacteroidetes bacterium GWE2_42_24]OFY25849.1 MAG: hypothetical protein A2X09_09400 [Bacteroidetes bacterium GWF2_43_11]HBZ67557.1 hypothetical protein [Bacteroidales bacterium]